MNRLLRFAFCSAAIAAVATLIGGLEPKVAGQEPKKGPETKFTFKLEKDKKFYQSMTTNVDQVIKVMGQDLSQTQDSTFYFKWTPTKQEGDKWELTDEIEGVKMSIDISGNKISYDSAVADGGPTAGNPGLMDFFKKLIDTKFTVTLNAKSYKVEKVEGVKDFLNKLAAGNKQMDELLSRIMSEDATKQMCNPTFDLLPDNPETPRKPGDKWQKVIPSISLGPIGSYTVTYNITYVGQDKDMEKLEVEPSFVYTAPSATAQPANGLLFRIKEGKMTSEPGQKGVVLYNPKSQRIDSAEINIVMKGELTVTIGNTDTKVELRQTQKTKFVTSDASLLPKK